MRTPHFEDPDLPLSDLFATWPETAGVFLERKMLCPGCPIGPFHTIADACFEYDLDENLLRAELKRKILGSVETSKLRLTPQGHGDR